jgi:hypothetical protein
MLEIKMMNGLIVRALLGASLLVFAGACAGGDSGDGDTAPNNGVNNGANNGGGCVRDSDCEPTQFCVDTVCMEAACTRDANCPGGQICRQDNGECVTPDCLRSSECDDGEFCDPNDRTCREGCSLHSDCDNGELCNPNTHQCEAAANECEADDDCGEQEICQGNKCIDVECVDDRHCAELEVCNADTNKCEAAEGACADDADCGDDEKCDTQQGICVQVGCGECPDGQVCNEDTGQCGECFKDADCAEGQACNLTDNVCEDPDDRCQNDNDCADDETCNRVSGECEGLSECQPDSFEPNDDRDAARGIGDGSFEGLRICENDEDWYEFDVQAGNALEINVEFAHASGNIDLELYDPNQRRYGFASSNSDNERIFAENLPLSGSYRLRVFALEGARNGYTLRVTVTENMNQECAEDGFEDNDRPDQAAAIVPRTFEGLAICPGDPDLYKVRLERGERLRVALTFSHEAGDLDLGILTPDGEDTVVRSDTRDDNEEATTETLERGGDYIIVVHGATDATENTYAMEVEKLGTPPQCEDDANEPNDDIASARTLAPGIAENLHVCPGDEDWYAVALNAGDDIRVSMGFTHADGDLDLLLFRPGVDEAIASSRSRTDDEEVGFSDVPESGLYLIQVVGAAPDADNDYFLLIDRTQGMNDCNDDAGEENDNREQARLIEEGSLNGTICPGDEDWYAVHVNAGGAISALIEFTNAQGNLDLEVLNPEGEVVGSSTNDDADTETVEVSEVEQSGLYLVRIFSPRGGENDYELTVIVDAPQGCADDGEEENDDRDNASLLDFGETTGLTVCPEDDDFYAVELNAGDGLTAQIFFDDAEGDLDLQIQDEEGRILASSVSISDHEEATVGTVLNGGLYFVRVNGFLGATGDYDLNLQRIDGGTECDDDRQEPNDSRTRARALAAGEHTNLHICEGDDDWYSIDVEAGEILEVNLSFVDADGDIDVQVLDPNFAVIGQGFSVDDNERVARRAAVSGTFFVRVFSFLQIDNDYDMTLTILPEDSCLEDNDEENDSREEAVRVFEGARSGLGLCQADGETEEDWYSFNVTEGQNISATITFVHADADLDLELYRGEEEGALDRSLGFRDSETVELEEAPAGTYYLRIFSFSRDVLRSDYSVLVDLN